VTRRGRFAALLYGTGGVVFLLDRLTKILAERHLQGRPPVVLIPRVLSLDYTTNSGGAFGVFGSQPWLFFAATVAVCAVIVFVSTRVAGVLPSVGLGMILGGAVGNLTDRVIHGSGVSGRVVDFIHLNLWPVFNAADSAIVIGAALVVLASARRSRS
jgi:signal peptidase II